jgi:small subunit ribosomal protein S8
MSMSDPIADMMTRIRNAIARRQSHVVIPSSNVKQAIAQILEAEGYIAGYEVLEEGTRSNIRVQLRYVNGKEPVISHLERVSKPGRRVYAKCRDIPWVLSGMGIAILTTPKGVMTGRDARRAQVGGEVLCYIW